MCGLCVYVIDVNVIWFAHTWRSRYIFKRESQLNVRFLLFFIANAVCKMNRDSCLCSVCAARAISHSYVLILHWSGKVDDASWRARSCRTNEYKGELKRKHSAASWSKHKAWSIRWNEKSYKTSESRFYHTILEWLFWGHNFHKAIYCYFKFIIVTQRRLLLNFIVDQRFDRWRWRWRSHWHDMNTGRSAID